MCRRHSYKDQQLQEEVISEILLQPAIHILIYRAECTNFLKEIGDATKIMACLDADHEQMMKVEACAKKKLNGELGYFISLLIIYKFIIIFQMHQLRYSSEPDYPSYSSNRDSIIGRVWSSCSRRASFGPS